MLVCMIFETNLKCLDANRLATALMHCDLTKSLVPVKKKFQVKNPGLSPAFLKTAFHRAPCRLGGQSILAHLKDSLVRSNVNYH